MENNGPCPGFDMSLFSAANQIAIENTRKEKKKIYTNRLYKNSTNISDPFGFHLLVHLLAMM